MLSVPLGEYRHAADKLTLSQNQLLAVTKNRLRQPRLTRRQFSLSFCPNTNLLTACLETPSNSAAAVWLPLHASSARRKSWFRTCARYSSTLNPLDGSGNAAKGSFAGRSAVIIRGSRIIKTVPHWS